MQRSKRINKFYYALISDVHNKALAEHLTLHNKEALRYGLKLVDESYPKIDNKPVSSARLTNKELSSHIEFIIMFLGHYGITPQFVTDEWERVKQQYKGY